MKATPKSCSCRACKRGKQSKAAKFMMNRMDRSIRTAWRNQRWQQDPIVAAAPAGNLFD